MSRILALAALVLALAACGGDDDEEAAGFDTTQTATAPAETAPAESAPAETQPSSGPCASVDLPTPRASGQEEAPTEPADPEKTYTVVVRTNCGEFTMTLDPDASPKAVASFAELAENDFFDGTTFHRIVPGFVIQGGDPSGTGTGGPGYLTEDPPASGTTYTRYVVAMAKTGADPPGTAGSQFFVVTAEDAGLPADYAVIGTVTDGKDVVDLIGTLGDVNEQPTVPVVVEDMAVTIE